MNAPLPDLDTSSVPLVTLANGVRIVALRQPQFASANVSVFVRTGSRHESARLNGISHVVEHMAFKGTRARSCQQINLDAERLGAEVNAHTDKDHTAYHMRGMARHALPFVEMLADIVQHCTFPEAELERERQVILQEFAEDDDDAFSTAFKLFDKMCFGTHPLAQPVIGNRRNIARFTRDELLGYVQQQYTGANVVVAATGAIEPQAVIDAAAAAFGGLPAGAPNLVPPPAYVGGFAARRQPGVSQTHVVLGFPLPDLRAPEHPAAIVAAALFGEGMSSPLMDEIRERRGLAYYVACSADLGDLAGQFVVEASMAPEHAVEFATEVVRLLRAQAGRIDPVGLERARNQIAVRRLEVQERPFRLLEEAAQDLFVHGQLRSPAQRLAAIEAVDADAVQAVMHRMLTALPAVGVAGDVRRGAADGLKAVLATPLA
jgi:predicted Zn-dependent peptidase